MSIKLEHIRLPQHLDLLAPDGSEIRILAQTTRGSMVHCSLPPGETSKAVRHRTVDELWYFLTGQGQVWRKNPEAEEIDQVQPGNSLNIPCGTSFQFYNPGDEPLCFVIVTMPPWPGEDEAIPVPGHWPTV